MMNTLLLLSMALLQGPGVSVEGQGRRVGGEYELSIMGKGRRLPDDARVGLRFRRIVNRVDWASGAIETRAMDHVWGRCASVERGTFQHREVLPSPGAVEVEFSFLEGGDAPPEPFTKVFRAAAVPEVLGALRGDVKRMDRALAEARGLLEDLACGKGRAVRKRLEKARLAAQEDAVSSVLSATGEKLDLFLADLEGSLEIVRADLQSAVTGERFSFESARAALAGIEAIAGREKRLIQVREARWLAHEIARLAESGDARRLWARAEPSIGRSLKALEESSREGRGVELAAFLADLELSFLWAQDTLSSTGSSWEGLQHRLIQEGATLEESLRRGE